ncbi:MULTISPECIES: bacterial transcriptional activator domain-containing protein [unclassified Frankia]|uniref:bacterial transcriptional activator domain-containing protein n=1 Tax=unclassified Frankia TaxID=2632575 RepID=UPI002024ECDB
MPGELFRATDVAIRIMGEIAVEAPGPCDPDRREFLTELVVYLALHRSGVLSSALSAVLLPPGTPDDVLNDELEHVAGWLGSDNEGRPHITVSDNECWRLTDDVRCDWDLFVAYTHRSAQPETDAEDDLTTALRLVAGPLWTNLPAGRYRWLDSGRIRTITSTAVVDVAHRLANLTLGNGDTVTAIAACRTGLRAAPTAEILWRDLLRTVAARHDRKALEAVINEMYQMIAPSRTGLGIQAETNALVRELLPGFRRRQQISGRRSTITGR